MKANDITTHFWKYQTWMIDNGDARAIRKHYIAYVDTPTFLPSIHRQTDCARACDIVQKEYCLSRYFYLFMEDYLLVVQGWSYIS